MICEFILSNLSFAHLVVILLSYGLGSKESCQILLFPFLYNCTPRLSKTPDALYCFPDLKFHKPCHITEVQKCAIS